MPHFWPKTSYQMLINAEGVGEADNMVFDFLKAVTRYDRDTADVYLASGQIAIHSSTTMTLPEGVEFPEPTPAQVPTLPKREGEE